MAAPKLDAQMRSDAAAVAIATPLLTAIESHIPGAIAGADPEELHDLRVAVRRTRALQRELRGVFPPAELARSRAGFRELQRMTGAARDLDVHLADLDAEDDPALEPLRTLLLADREQARTSMAAELRSPATRAALTGWGALLSRLTALPAEGRPDAARPVGAVAAKRIRRVYRRMVEMGEAIGDDSPPEALHDLRKKGKELRYLLEFFAPLFGDEATRPMVKTLKALQDVLGRFQDREVQAAALLALVARAPEHDAAARAAAGALAERLAADQAAARAEFAQRFAPFASPARRRAVKATFR